jgi:hypothetical protein
MTTIPDLRRAIRKAPRPGDRIVGWLAPRLMRTVTRLGRHHDDHT